MNSSPSLTASSADDHAVKSRILNDLIDVIDPEGKRTGNEINVGGFDLFWKNGPVKTSAGGGVTSGLYAKTFKQRLNTAFGFTANSVTAFYYILLQYFFISGCARPRDPLSKNFEYC